MKCYIYRRISGPPAGSYFNFYENTGARLTLKGLVEVTGLSYSTLKRRQPDEDGITIYRKGAFSWEVFITELKK